MQTSYINASACWKAILADAEANRHLLGEVEGFARTNTSPTEIVFGTSGWRGEIGTDYTFRNVRIVAAAIVEMFRAGDPVVMQAMGVKDFAEIRQRGALVGHDNRFLGPDFAMEVAGTFQAAGIRTWYAGEAATPEFSAGIEMLHAACCVNLTPSHNPANYAGFKFNPSDGGPAGSEITTQIEKIANRMMKEGIAPEQAPAIKPETIDLTALYIEYLKKRGTIDLEKITSFIAGADCSICIDNVHGSTRGRMERILGENPRITYLRTADDYLFGGVAPEPSETNMAGVEEALSSSSAQLKLGAIMDPDGDRIRFSDGTMQIPMNYFGAMAFHFLHVHKKFTGVAAKSVGTSNLVNAIAEQLGLPIKETKVGFKNFRPYLLQTAKEKAVAAFEESDGITGYNHTLEKDALFGLLLAIEMMAVTGKNLSVYLDEIMEEFGRFYPDRAGISVDRALVGKPLVEKLAVIGQAHPVGSSLEIGGMKRTVKDLITVDGTKLVFDDGSWLMIRPSGTEPKVRFYIEARTEAGKAAVFALAEEMTKQALGA